MTINISITKATPSTAQKVFQSLHWALCGKLMKMAMPLQPLSPTGEVRVGGSLLWPVQHRCVG